MQQCPALVPSSIRPLRLLFGDDSLLRRACKLYDKGLITHFIRYCLFSLKGSQNAFSHLMFHKRTNASFFLGLGTCLYVIKTAVTVEFVQNRPNMCTKPSKYVYKTVLICTKPSKYVYKTVRICVQNRPNMCTKPSKYVYYIQNRQMALFFNRTQVVVDESIHTNV